MKGGTVTKRALLIGSQTYGLTGPNSDVELMAETFESRGFDASPLLRVADESGSPAGASTADPPAAAIIGDDPLTVLDGAGLAVNKGQLPTTAASTGRWPRRSASSRPTGSAA
jgi:hypothetical protein